PDAARVEAGYVGDDLLDAGPDVLSRNAHALLLRAASRGRRRAAPGSRGSKGLGSPRLPACCSVDKKLKDSKGVQAILFPFSPGDSTAAGQILGLGEEPEVVGQPHGIPAAMHPQLLQDAVDVVLDRLHRDAEALAHLLVA